MAGAEGWGKNASHAALALSMPGLVASAWALMPRGLGIAQIPWSVSGISLMLLLAWCAATDAIRGKIYNAATYPAMLWALAINLAPGWPGSWPGGSPEFFAPLGGIGPASCLLGGLACFAVMAVSFLTAGGGAGDVKLATAIGLLIGVERGLAALVYTYLAAAAFSLAYLAMLGALGTAAWVVSSRIGVVVMPLLFVSPDLEKRHLLRRKIRMGPFFAIGTLVAVLRGGLG